MTARSSWSRRLRELSGVAGIVAAALVAVLLNVVLARHYRRWDCTMHRIYTLAPATIETLAGLRGEVQIDVLLPSKDPLTGSVRALLSEYQARTRLLHVVYTDPDWHPAEFLALQQKYGVVAGRTEDGQLVMDAAVVVSAPSAKPYFLSPADFVDVSEDERRARSRMEQAFTLALRSVVDGDRPAICFVSGHGEARVDDGGPRGLGELAARLRKNNYDVEVVETRTSSAARALDRCRVALVVAPQQPFAPEESERLISWFRAKGNLMILSGPVPDPASQRLVPLGLDPIAAAGGVVLDDDFIFEEDPNRKLPNGLGDQFVVQVRAHRVTMGLVGERNEDLKVVVASARSLSTAAGSPVVPAELLSTSSEAFGMTEFFAWGKRGGAPEKGARDRTGPLTVAMASELGAQKAQAGDHGPRMVVVGAATPALGQNWQEPALHGGALFVESAIAWLSARPNMVDIPDKPAAVGVRISEDKLGDVWRYVMLYIPTAVALLGLSVYLRRRATEGSAVRAPKEKGSGA